MKHLLVEALGCSAEETGMPPNSGFEVPGCCLKCAHHLSCRVIIGI
jgi:hypothetical protein